MGGAPASASVERVSASSPISVMSRAPLRSPWQGTGAAWYEETVLGTRATEVVLPQQAATLSLPAGPSSRPRTRSS